MKRDFDTIRDILVYVESLHEGKDEIKGKSFDMNEDDEIKRYKLLVHFEILQEAGYIKNVYLQKNAMGRLVGLSAYNAELTMKGHDFLDSIRHDNNWTKIKEVITKAGGCVTMSLLQTIATDILSGHIMSLLPKIQK